MRSPEAKTLVQCDFDGTITEEDVSFMLLDTFADGDWRRLLGDYRQGKISVGRFNAEAFAMIKADRQSLLGAIKDKVEIRAGFRELAAYCRGRGLRFVIVSNGLDFYIKAILSDINVDNIEVFAAETRFPPQGLQVQYIGPDGSYLDDKFKEAYVDFFLSGGYRVIYVGNGVSDILPARRCHHLFATGDLLASCRKMKLDCSAFVDFNDIVSGLQSLLQDIKGHNA